MAEVGPTGEGAGSAAALATDDFALQPIPGHALAPAYLAGALLLASNISLPVLIVGGRLGVARGLAGTVHASLWGGLVLGVIAGACAWAGARSRLSTYLLIVRAFGERGGQCISLLLWCCAVGWFGVVLMLFADTMVRLAGVAVPVWAVAGTLLMTGTTLAGFWELSRLSNVMLPAKLGLLAWAIWAALHQQGAMPPAPLPSHAALDDRGAISMVVGGWIVGAVVAPDFFRYARSAAGGALAGAAALGIGYPAVLVASCVPAIATGNGDLLETVTRLGLGWVALAIILLSSWTNGALNLYSGSLMLAVPFPQRRAVLIWVAAGFGTVLGVAGIAERLVPYLTTLSLVVPPIAGIYLPRFALDQCRGAPLPPAPWRPGALIALAVGVAAAGSSGSTGLALSGIGAVDSLVTSAAVYLLLEAASAVLRPRGTAAAA